MAVDKGLTELSEGGSRMSGWELNNIARLPESHLLSKKNLSRGVTPQ